jgi:hypothetical protein
MTAFLLIAVFTLVALEVLWAHFGPSDHSDIPLVAWLVLAVFLFVEWMVQKIEQAHCPHVNARTMNDHVECPDCKRSWKW